MMIYYLYTGILICLCMQYKVQLIGVKGFINVMERDTGIEILHELQEDMVLKSRTGSYS